MSAIILHMSCSKYLVCFYYLAQNCPFSAFSLPATLADDVESARWLLPTLEVLWGICTFAQSRVTNVHQLYALRFLVGMLEAPVFAGTHFILGTPLPPTTIDSHKTNCRQQGHGTPAPNSSNEPACGSSATPWAAW